VLPVYRVVMDASKPKTGRGIFPDIEVDPSSVALREGWDPKITKVKELIRKKQQ